MGTTNPICSVEGCEGKHNARGLCGKHYAEWKSEFNSSNGLECQSEGCTRPSYAREMCHMHYQIWLLGGGKTREKNRVCSVSGCGRKHAALGLCKLHHKRMRKHGSTDLPDGTPIRNCGRLCSVAGCEKPSTVKGMCRPHSRASAKHGDPLAVSDRMWTGKRLNTLVESRGGSLVDSISDESAVRSRRLYSVRCKDGHVWVARPNSILKGEWCRQCLLKKTRCTGERFRRIVEDNGGSTAVADEASMPSRKKHPVKCRFGHEWEITPSKLLQAGWCPVCAASDGFQKHVSDDMKLLISQRNARLRARLNNRYKTDLEYKIKSNVRSMTCSAFRSQSVRKNSKTFILLGCTAAELFEHLSAKFLPGMTPENHGRGPGKWQIDHIKPIASFDLSDPIQQAACFHFTNTQPLWWEDNTFKNARLDWDIRIHGKHRPTDLLPQV